MRTLTSREHTNREYEQELRRLREQLLLMGAKVEEIIRGSVRALTERDTALAEQMIAFDKKINQLELEIDDTTNIFTRPRERETEDYITGRFG